MLYFIIDVSGRNGVKEGTNCRSFEDYTADANQTQ